MTAWPAGGIGTTNVDNPNDVPATARGDLLNAIQQLNQAIAALGGANGVCGLDANSLVPQVNIPITPFGTGIFKDSSPGSRSWTTPAGVYRIKVWQTGGGGGGGYTTPGTGGDHGGGGGASGVAYTYFTTAPGQVFPYTIGTHGAGHGSGSDGNGADGTGTSFTSPAGATPASHTTTCPGGSGGLGPPADRFGGAGSLPTGGDVNLWGGAGISGGARGGAGGSNAFTGGAAGATGYGGGGGFGSGAGTPGFDGLDGFIVIEW